MLLSLLAVVVAVLMTLLLVVLVVEHQEVMVVMDLDPEVVEEELNLQADQVGLVVEEHSKADQVLEAVVVDILVVLVEIPTLDVVLMEQVVVDQDILVV